MSEPIDAEQLATVKKIAEKLEIESLPAYLKTLFGKELAAEQLTKDQATKAMNAMKAKAQRLGIVLEGPGPKGGATEKQLQFIESLVGRGRISPAMLTGFIKDIDPAASIPQQLTKRGASQLIDRLTGLSGGARRDDLDF
jgi:hypothetical protein